MADLLTAQFTVVTVNAQGQEIDRYTATAPYWCQALDLAQPFGMMAIPGGQFVMGAPVTEAGCAKAQIPQHSVEIDPFFLSQFPVTQAQWEAVAALPKVSRGLNPDPASCKGANRPVDKITWEEAVEFCDRLTQHTALPYRLPSEAEWEYACRAGTTTPFHFGATLTTDLANYSGVDWEYMGKICSRGAYGSGPLGNDRRESTPVGTFQVANAFGLFDLHGNVREWCADCWHDNYEGSPSDGSAWTTGGDAAKRVLRGGSWNTGPNACRSAFRGRLEADATLYDIGFRVACST